MFSFLTLLLMICLQRDLCKFWSERILQEMCIRDRYHIKHSVDPDARWTLRGKPFGNPLGRRAVRWHEVRNRQRELKEGHSEDYRNNPCLLYTSILFQRCSAPVSAWSAFLPCDEKRTPLFRDVQFQAKFVILILKIQPQRSRRVLVPVLKFLYIRRFYPVSYTHLYLSKFINLHLHTC